MNTVTESETPTQERMRERLSKNTYYGAKDRETIHDSADLTTSVHNDPKPKN